VEKVLDTLFHGLKVAAALCLAVMIVLVFCNVVLRYAFNQGISFSEEVASWCMTWMTYTAGLVAFREHGHLGFDAFLSFLSSGLQRFFLSIAQLLMIAIMGMFCYGSWQQTLINLDNMAPASGISVGFLYGIGVIFSVGAIAVLLGDLYRIATGKNVVTISSEAAEVLAEVGGSEHETHKP
jgi:TRAP-type C4-dicarboxylate transport system permease small subunit